MWQICLDKKGGCITAMTQRGDETLQAACLCRDCVWGRDQQMGSYLMNNAGLIHLTVILLYFWRERKANQYL